MFDKRIQEIIFFQTTHDHIKYIAQELDRPILIRLNKFFTLLKESKVYPKDIFEFNKAIDSFETIKLNLITGAWEILKANNNIEEISMDNKVVISKKDVIQSLNNQETNFSEKLNNLYTKTKNSQKKMFDKFNKKE